MKRLLVLYGLLTVSALFSGEERSEKLKAWVQRLDKITIVNTWTNTTLTMPITDTTTFFEVQQMLRNNGFRRSLVHGIDSVPITFIERPKCCWGCWPILCCRQPQPRRYEVFSSLSVLRTMKSLINEYDTCELEIHWPRSDHDMCLFEVHGLRSDARIRK